MYAKKKSVSMKVVVLMMALVLLIGCSIGGTLAWLAMKTAPVVNTFTAGNINITLTETGTNANAKSFKMVPGVTYVKDPVVTVAAGSEPCWLFVKIEESGNVGTNSFSDYISYGVNKAKWGTIPVASETDPETGVKYSVFAMEVSASDADQPFYVLADTYTPNVEDEYDNGCVMIPDGLTKTKMDAVTDDNKPTLTFTAYAFQKEGFATAAAAWNEAKELG